MMVIVVKDEPIQWHIPRTTYDRCPGFPYGIPADAPDYRSLQAGRDVRAEYPTTCGAALGLLAHNRRACMGKCMGGARVIELRTTATAWLGATGFSREEADFIYREARHVGSGRNAVLSRFRPGLYWIEDWETGTRQRRRVIAVAPGFLRVRP